MKKAIYVGSFNPITNAHLEIIEKASALFDTVIVLVAENTAKNFYNKPDADKRIALIEAALRRNQILNVSVATLPSYNLTVNYADVMGCNYMVRGLRAVSDFDYEFQMYQTNKSIDKKIETVYLMPSTQNMFLSSSMVRELMKCKQDVSQFVPWTQEEYDE